MVDKTAAARRLKRDYLQLMREPVPYVHAAPLPSNILEWHFVIEGGPSTLYEGGFYHGKLLFSSDFPFKPPSIFMITPSGRFQTNTRLCLSISDYHPDTWNPAWTLSTILVGITSFMNESSPTLGSISTSDSEKSKLAKKSYAFNVKNRTFCLLFPELADNLREIIRKEEEANRLANELGNGVQFEQCLNTSQDPSVSAWLYNLIIFTALIAVGMFVKYVVTAA